MKVDFAAAREKAEKQGVLSKGDYFKPSEGANKVRLVSECLPHAGEYNGRPTFKWLCYIIDRKDGRIKPYFMPDTIYKQIIALQQSDDYAFDEVPMPYDITISAIGAGSKEVKYSTQGARTNTPLSPAEKALLQGTEPIAKLQARLNEEKQAMSDEATQPDPDSEGPDVPDFMKEA